jgi:hypothetical protein
MSIWEALEDGARNAAAERGYTLRAESLASKWGFGDGDGLDDYMYDLRDLGLIDHTPERNSFLYAAVQKFLVPELTRRGITAEIVVIGSNHNPVRADTINGADVDHYGAPPPACLAGVEVTVSRAELLALATVLEPRR